MFFVIGAIAWVEKTINGNRSSFLGGAGLNIGVAAIRNSVDAVLVSLFGSPQPKPPVRYANLLRFCQQHAGRTARFSYVDSENDSESVIECDFGVLLNLTEYACTFTQEYTDNWVHICCRAPLDARLMIEHVSKYNPRCISLDFMYTSIRSILPTVKHLLPKVEYIFMNKLEHLIARELNIQEFFSGTFIVTDGPNGASLLASDHVVCQVSGIPQTNVIDTSAAGDTFTGTFISRVMQGYDFSESLSFANQQAAEIVFVPGVGFKDDVLFDNT
jgi:sugar/nucleoside kinase (ribokinase family)